MIVTIGTRKGGSGKSTIATNLAAMRKIKGHDVSIVDTDDQQSSAMWGAIRSQLSESKMDSAYIPVLCSTGKGVLPAIQAHATKYEDLIIDSPGKDAPELRASEIASDVVIIPLRASQFDLWAMEKDLNMIEEIKGLKESVGAPFRTVIVFNGMHTHPSVKKKQLEGMSEFLKALSGKIENCGIEICPHHISHRGVFNAATMNGECVLEAATKSRSDENAVFEMNMVYKFIFGEN